jgi:manganese-dependent ADP-ribose/CDP-alcohol diphosphatase
MTTPHWNRRGFLKATLLAASAPAILRGAAQAGFEIGLVADAQYADIDDKGTRYYRSSLQKLGDAVEYFNGRNLDFCAHLGDLIDREWRSFDEITRPLAASRHRWHHLLGNHDFDVLEDLKAKVPGRLGLEARYRFFDHRDFRFVILDTNDVSTYAHAAGSSERATAAAELKRLETEKVRQAKPWNGGIGAEQLAWFDRACTDARAQRRKVIVLAHHPVAPANDHNVWNSSAVLKLIERHSHVVAWLNGHNHAGNFAVHAGVTCVTMHGMVETAATTAYATAQLLDDRMIITGRGREPSRELIFRRVV